MVQYYTPDPSVYQRKSTLSQAIEGGISGYQMAREMANKRAQLELQQRQEASEEKLRGAQTTQTQAQATQTQAQTAHLPEQYAMNREVMKHYLAAQNLTSYQNQQTVVNNHLAHLMSYPSDARPKAYQQMKTELSGAGVDISQLPNVYNPDVERKGLLAVQESPAGVDQKKVQNAAHMQVLKDRGAIAAAQVKAGITPAKEYLGEAAQQGAPGAVAAPVDETQKAFHTAEGQKNSDYFDTVSTNATNASKILSDVQEIRGLGGQIPAQFGIVRGSTINLTPKGQAAMRAMNKMILDMFGQMVHIGKGGNLLQTTIKKSKPGPHQSYEGLQRTLNLYESSTRLAIQKNQFGNFLKQNGIYDRNHIQTIWNKFEEQYPAIDKKGDINPHIHSKWMEFLQKNPGVLQGKPSKIGGSGSRPKGFVMPGETPQVSAPPATPTQSTPSWGYDAPNPYD